MSVFEVRDPIHSRISFNELERRVIDHPFVQRLRQIHQLSLVLSYVYPGATHDRFSHALGTMHLAGRLAGRVRSSMEHAELKLEERTWEELKQVMRLAGLLHDVGHGPFSHSSEEVFPSLTDLPLNNAWWKEGKRPFRKAKHEDYSVLLIQALAEEGVLPETMAQDIASLVHAEVVPSPWFEDLEYVAPGLHVVCKSLISGEVDCDRMDYLLRDSYYCGVSYGHFDLDWLISSLGMTVHEGECVLKVSENGVRAFEDMLLARYHMIDQVYFHKTTVGFVAYLARAFKDGELSLSIPGDPYAYTQLQDGVVIEHLREAARAGKYWSKHLVLRLPAKHVMRFQKASKRDDQRLAGLVELCRREKIHFFVQEMQNQLSRLDLSLSAPPKLYVSRKTEKGSELVPIEQFSNLLQRYNETLAFTDFFVLREDYERFKSKL